MAQAGQRKCLCCGLFFDPDHRNRDRQRYCFAADCKHASKAASQTAWLARPENIGYFRGPVHVARVQAWRAAHPGYSRCKRRSPRALQEPLITQVLDPPEQSPNRGEIAEVAALQDPLTALPPALAGLIAHLFEVTLQEDMAFTTRRLVQLGRDVINGSRREDSQAGCDQAASAARSAAPGARAVQLD